MNDKMNLKKLYSSSRNLLEACPSVQCALDSCIQK